MTKSKFTDRSNSVLPYTQETYRDILGAITRQYNLKYASCLRLSAQGNDFTSNLSYQQNNQFINNTVNDCRIIAIKVNKSISPFEWANLRSDPTYIKLCAASTFFSIKDNGLSIPIRTTNTLTIFSIASSMNDQDWIEFITNELPALTSLAQRFTITMRSQFGNMNQPHMNTLPKLTKKEIGALVSYISNPHKTSHTKKLATHLKSARHKLSALTNNHAYARAISLGLIT